MTNSVALAVVLMGFLVGFTIMALVIKSKPTAVEKPTVVKKVIQAPKQIIIKESQKYVIDSEPCRTADIIYYVGTEGNITTLACGNLREVNH